MMKAYGIEKEDFPSITAYFSSLSFDENENTNMIRATTMALSAVTGGVDTLNVMTADHKGSAFHRRMARNVQHLLKMECYLDRITDPAAGSFYIEQLTAKIAETAWQKFKQRV
jgi:methylmalonyl-CoA mutase